MNDEYEKGYQDGQMDSEEEFLQDLRNASSINVNLETRLGWEIATVTLVTTRDSKLYALLANSFAKSTKSVVPEASNPTNPQEMASESAESVV